ncbi:MAG: lamin tail domain-containing protein [Bacteroidia bacterium]|nr:lamin tail domain-containing protein [Bacteroidia bacterium]
MKKFTLFFLIIPLFAAGQISDNFEDGDISGWTQSTQGRWAASTDNPINGSYSLHHVYDNTSSGIDLVSFPMYLQDISSDTIIWKFQIRHGYDPSSYNNWSIFICSDQDAVTMNNNFVPHGYIIGVNYNDDDDNIKFWKTLNESITEILNTGYNWENNIGASNFCSFEITRAPIGVWTINIDADGGFNNLVNIGMVIDTTYLSGIYYVIYYKYSSTQDRKLWIDDIQVMSSGVNPNNINSVIAQPDLPVVNDSISSVATTSEQAVDVFRFKISDAGSGDGLPTDVTQIVIKNCHPANEASWSNNIQGIVLKDGFEVINTNATILENDIIITVPEGNLLVPDGAEKDITLAVYLKTSIEDGAKLKFKIDSVGHGCYSSPSGSGFSDNFGSEIISEEFTIDVAATKLNFVSYPEIVGVGIFFSASVSATDIYGNTDTDGNITVTLSKDYGQGDLSSVSALTQSLVSGCFTWYLLTYDTTGYFTLLVSDSNSILTGAVTYYINAIVFPETINETFDDGNFSNNPVWLGNTNNFLVNPSSLELQLFPVSSDPDTSYLVTNLNTDYDSLEWHFYTRLEFEPSGNNNARFYLISDKNNLTGELNGYFIQIGEAGSNDAIELFKQNDTVITSICRGGEGQIASYPQVRVKVTRSASGYWNLYADLNGDFIFLPQASGFDNSFSPDVFSCGIYCLHLSSSYNKKFFFDDIYIGPIIIDTVPPDVNSIKVTGTNSIDVEFSEGVELYSSILFSNYILNDSIYPIDLERDAQSYNIVHLTFENNFSEEIENKLTIMNVEDFEGNAITIIEKIFVLYYPKEFDIIINEIMTDITPSPLVLPPANYIELYNRTAYDISIENWAIQITLSSAAKYLPDIILRSDEYLIITESLFENQFEQYGNVVSFTSFDPSNAGTIILRDEKGGIIHSVTYDENFYNDNYKNGGGWSLEMIDRSNPCGGINNWRASSDVRGGTPGEQNSVFSNNPDNIIPELLRVAVINTDTIRLYFSEPVHPASVLSPTLFSVDYGVGSPITVIPDEPENKTVVLVFAYPFNHDTIYTITVKDSITDTDKTFDLKDLVIGNRDVNTLEFKTIKNIAENGYLVFPQEYYVLTANPQWVKEHYYSKNQGNFVEVALPSYDDDTGVVVVFDKAERIIDELAYGESMHFQLLNNKEGVALERINFDRPANDRTNWFSAAENVGFGTPTYENSQFRTEESVTQEITLDPEVFSPDNDGFDDILNIIYKMDKHGYTANVYIFDSRGRLVRSITENELLGMEGRFIWDGLNETKKRCNTGIYIVYIEIFNLEGNIKKHKKTCVLASKL